MPDPACALCAFCHLADDEVDGQTGGGAPVSAASRTPAGAPFSAPFSTAPFSTAPVTAGADPCVVEQATTEPAATAPATVAQARAEVGWLRHRLRRVYQGQPQDHAADRALAQVVRRFNIPAQLPEALLEGFEWDAAERRYETLADLHAYAARVAGTVGAMMALLMALLMGVLMGVRSAAGLARACDLGVAMQLSNIARDVGEHARSGRLYLPRQWLRDAGIDPDAWLASLLRAVVALAPPANGPRSAALAGHLLSGRGGDWQAARSRCLARPGPRQPPAGRPQRRAVTPAPKPAATAGGRDRAVRAAGAAGAATSGPLGDGLKPHATLG